MVSKPPSKSSRTHKVVKAKKTAKTKTASTYLHKFQSFSQRITNLKIDPLRRRRNNEDRRELSGDETTYFGRALQEWRDINLSHTFTTFAKEAAPLCESLPMVLHNEDQIMEVLNRYVERGDALAMEPLLELLSHFARDVDARFEAHFERAVSTVLRMASAHSDPAVIEWSFTCLAWLFKYLSRLLTPDLRPVYDLLAPYLGRGVQKPYIIRFTAEALSFLIRKAAATYDRDSHALDLIVSHVLRDCRATETHSHQQLYQEGLMTLFTEAIVGVGIGINSNGISVIKSLLQNIEKSSMNRDSAAENIVCGILTSLIHHCNTETFQPILSCVFDVINASNRTNRAGNLSFSGRLVFIMVTVRKGSRIENWKEATAVTNKIVMRSSQFTEINDAVASSVLSALGTIIHHASIDAALLAQGTFDEIRSGKWTLHFLKLCDFVLRLNSEKFQHFFLPHLQNFITSHWEENKVTLLALLPKLQPAKLTPPAEMVEDILRDLENALLIDGTADNTLERIAFANYSLSAFPFLKFEQEHQEKAHKLLLNMIQTGLTNDVQMSALFQDFAIGAGLHHLMSMKPDPFTIEHLWPWLCEASPRFFTLPKFWSNLRRFVTMCKPSDFEHSSVTTLEDSLVQSLCSTSHSIREDCLEILRELYRLRVLETPSVLSTAVTIESTSVSLETARSISLHIRRLGPGYKSLPADDLLMAKAIPTYCFGLLHINLSAAWDDATNVLSMICQSKFGEEVAMSLAQAWLLGDPQPVEETAETSEILDIDSEGFKVFSDFECPNLAKCAAIRDQVFEQTRSGCLSPSQKILLDQKRIPIISENARAQALKVLQKSIHIAEKRSRLLVPILLRWKQSQDGIEIENGISAARWSRKDQKSLLGIFAEFVNPKVLYKSIEVYDALLALCANGDVEIQRSALKAILAWKNVSVTRYEETLNNLLDDARFREEISVFLKQRSEGDQEGIQIDDEADLMPVLLHILYGRAVGGKNDTQNGRRKAIFIALSRFGEKRLGAFLDVALSPFHENHLLGNSELNMTEFNAAQVPYRKQLGILNMLNEMLDTLGADLEPFVKDIMTSVLYCTLNASIILNRESHESGQETSLLRSIRQKGVQCLVEVYSRMTTSGSPYLSSLIIDQVISPRLSSFEFENLQSVSGTLRLFAAWSRSAETSETFFGSRHDILLSVAGLLGNRLAKAEVRLFILQDILANLLLQAEKSILRPCVSGFVKSIGKVVEQQPGKPILNASIKSFSGIAILITGHEETAGVLRICTDLLTKPGKIVPTYVKSDLLKTIGHLLDNSELKERDKLFEALCGLLSRLHEPKERLLTSQTLMKLVQKDPALLQAAKICEDLNSLGSRLDEPDYDRRERAFAWIYESSKTMTVLQWLPIVHNCLYYIRDNDDRVNRSSASHGLELLIDAAAESNDEHDLIPLLDTAVFEGIERGMQNSSELVRAEYLSLLGSVVEKLPEWQKVKKMRLLIAGGDEEASFFNNALHIQQHRRLRALRRLADEAPELNSHLSTKIFIPLLEHFVFDQAEGDSGRTLADQSVTTIGALAKALTWSSFRATFKRYLGYLKTKEDLEKTVLRLLGAIVDSLPQHASKLTSDGSNLDQFEKTIIEEMLPPLLDFLHLKDESTVDRRMPVAITIVKLLRSLSEAEFTVRLPAVLTDICHILKSRSQEARDQTRKTLVTIASLVGPSYFSFILKELRSVLKRGYQLHVLSFTMHSLLVDVTGLYEDGNLEGCLPDLMAVILDDIFGVAGQEKEAEEYKTSMKEIKSSKSFDSMELLAQMTEIRHLGQLIHPVHALLREKLDMKSVKKIDDLLARLRKGLDQNPMSGSTDMLSFCWEIVNLVYKEESSVHTEHGTADYRVDKFLVKPESSKLSNGNEKTAAYTFKLRSFALNLARRVVRRHEELRIAANMAGFLPIAGDALLQGEEEVKLAALKFLSAIMNLPLRELENNAPVYVEEALGLIKSSPNITMELPKAALELVISVLRDRRTVEVKEKDMAILLKRLKADIDEPDRQSVIYKFLRAVLGRKIVITEVYEVMDEVNKAMVTNPDRSIREGARSAYLQFVMDYPQGKDRWIKHAEFIKQNLKYEHAAGRQSIMEFLNQLLSKIGEGALQQQLSSMVFVPLVLAHVGDSEATCRGMAAMLIGRIFELASDEELAAFISIMDQWIQNDGKPIIKAAAIKCWSILISTRSLPTTQLEGLRDQLERILNAFVDGESAERLPTLNALKAFAVLVENFPSVGYAQTSGRIWAMLQSLPSSAGMEIQETGVKLLGTFFNDIASTSSKDETGLAAIPLQGSGGLELHPQDMQRLCTGVLRVLRVHSSGSSETLLTQGMRNLTFLGRCFAANQMVWESKEVGDEGLSEDENELSVESRPKNSALAHLFGRLAAIVRQDKFSESARIAALQCEATTINQIDEIPNMQTILRPLCVLTDPSVPKPPGEAHKMLVDKAHELLDLIRKKIGSEAFVTALGAARLETKQRREGRRQKRRIEAVSAPERWAQQKKRKHDAMKAKQKLKGSEARERRRGW